MLNKLTDAISIKLYSIFGDGYKIYTETVKQGLDEPCFSIIPLPATNKQVVGNRYFKVNPFCIHYFPSTDEQFNEINNVLEDLFSILEYITLTETLNGETKTSLVRGTQMRGEVDDGVLHFFVNFDLFCYRVFDGDDAMETIFVDSKAKG